MGTIFFVSTEVGNPAHDIDAVNSRPMAKINAAGNPVSASYADKANTALSSSYAYSASIAARTGSPQ